MMLADHPLELLLDFVHKEVTLPYAGQKVRFKLSQSLFSSYDVDDGSRRLLRTILERFSLESIDSVLDIGCGVGVLGLCLKAARPSIHLVVQDRDALALSFTRENGALNGLLPLTFAGSLAFWGLKEQKFDLIMSNLPGKAGKPVLEFLIQQMPSYLAPNGTAAVVIVKPLANLIATAIAKNRGEIVFQAGTANHTIFHFRNGEKRGNQSSLKPYLRGKGQFKHKWGQYEIDAGFNLPEFDEYSYDSRTAIKLLPVLGQADPILFWNPGQGHLPIVWQQLHKNSTVALTLAGRDGLSLAVSQHNLVLNGIDPTRIMTLHQPTLFELDKQYARIVLFPDMDPGVPWARLLPEVLERRLMPGGKALVAGKSGFIGRLLAAQKSAKTVLSPRQSKKGRGVRAVLLEKK